MSPRHPMLEKQRQKVQREQRGWVLIAVGICLMHWAVFSIIRYVIITLETYSSSHGQPMPFALVLINATWDFSWWLPVLCGWTLLTLACQLRGLVTFRGEGILMLAIAFVIAPVDLATCIYVVSLAF